MEVVMRIRAAMIVAALSLVCLLLSLAAARPPDRALHQLFDEEWQWRLKEHPAFATSVGDPRYNDRLTDLSFAALARRDAHDRELLARIRRFDRSRLSPEDQLNYDLFLRNMRLAVDRQRFHMEYLPVSQRRGPH